GLLAHRVLVPADLGGHGRRAVVHVAGAELAVVVPAPRARERILLVVAVDRRRGDRAVGAEGDADGLDLAGDLDGRGDGPGGGAVADLTEIVRSPDEEARGVDQVGAVAGLGRPVVGRDRDGIGGAARR